MRNRKNLIHSFAKTLLITLLCTFGVGEMWGYYFPGTIKASRWDVKDNNMGDDGKITFYAVPAGGPYYCKLSDGSKMFKGAWTAESGGEGLTIEYEGGDDGAIKLTLSEERDIYVEVKADNKVLIKSLPASYKIYYNWAVSGEGWSDYMVYNGDGTYSCTGRCNLYPGTDPKYHFRPFSSDDYSSTSGDADTYITYTNNPAHENYCIFTYNPSNDKLDIRKCNTVNTTDAENSFIYFDNEKAGWTGTNRYFVIGRPETSKVYKMYEISNTKLWYIPNGTALDKWEDCGYYGIAVNSSTWGNGAWGPNNLANADPHYTAPYLIPQNLDSKYYYIIKKENGDNNGAITIEKKTNSYLTSLSLTVGYKYNLDGVEMTSGYTPAQVDMASYYFSNRFTVAANADQTINANTSGTYAKSINAAYRGEVVLTQSNLSDGYKFIGWYNGNTLEETGNTYTYYPNENTTISAKYEYRWTLKGTFPNESEWTEDHFIEHVGVNASSQDTGYVELSLPGNASFQFKVIDRESGAWHSCSGTTDGSEYSFTYLSDKEKDCSAHSGSEKNMIFQTAAPGTYKFAWNADTKELTITYPTSYLVTYNGNGNTGGTAPTGVYYESSATVTVAAEPDDWDKSEYTFGGWNTADDGSGSNYTAGSGQFTITHDTPLYAKWTQTVTLHDNNGEAHNGSTTATWNAAGPFSITAPTKDYYSVEGYYAEEECTNKVLTTSGALVDYSGYVESGKWVHADATVLYTKWTEDMHTVTVSAGAGGSVDETSVSAGGVTAIAITATPATGYKFIEWRETGETSNVTFANDKSSSTTITATGDATIEAVFGLRWSISGNWNANWSKNDHLMGNVGQTSGETPKDTCFVTIDTLKPNTDYRFAVIDRGIDGTSDTCWNRMSVQNPITYTSESKTRSVECGSDLGYTENIDFRTAGAGTYKFIFNITEKQVTVIYPESYTVTFGYGTGGGEVTASGSISGSISSGGYVNKDEDITFTQSAATGYTFAGWYDASSGGSAISCMSSDNVYDDIAAGIVVYAQYTPNPYTITLDKNSGAGQDVPASVTATYDSPTLATLSANPWRNGYSFNGWYDGEGGSGNLIISTSKTLQPNTDYTDAEGNWTHDGDVTLYAKWTLRWAISGSWDSWDADDHLLGNVGRNASSQDTCSVNISLAANTTYTFKVVNWKLDYDGAYTWLALENQGNMSYKTDTVTEAFDTQATTTRDKSCTMRTAGAGTYKFAYNLSDKKVTVTYPTSYTVTFGSGTGGTVTGASGSVSGSITSGQYVAAGENVTFTPSPAVSSTLKGWYNASSGGSAISGMSSSDNVLDAIAANATVYAQWVSSNFVIYRTGDMEDDPRLLEGDVETYAGGKIDKPIEYRMKVRELDKWYTLCLPFTVNAVKVWDDEDGEYYDIEPYYKDNLGYHGGHYIIRTPYTATDLPIADFDDWRDPSSESALPAPNTPYIIQWHNSYFEGKYVSFFGASGQTIPSTFSAGSAPSANEKVNVCVNNTMHAGALAGAYMLDPDYGTGAWLRLEDKNADRTIPPFECFIRATVTTTGRYLVIRRGMTITDTATAIDVISGQGGTEKVEKVLIDGQMYILRGDKMYTIQGKLVK